MKTEIPVEIVRATASDVSAMLALTAGQSSAAQWNVALMLGLFGDGPKRVVLKAMMHERLVGWLAARASANEWELENVVVTRSEQRKGIGVMLMRALVDTVNSSGGTAIHLEVRSSNQPAIALYQKLGFRQTGQRKNYYSTPTEDAVLFTCRL